MLGCFEKLNLEVWKVGSLEAWVAVRPDFNKTNKKVIQFFSVSYIF
jgi:hypothetical protein